VSYLYTPLAELDAAPSADAIADAIRRGDTEALTTIAGDQISSYLDTTIPEGTGGFIGQFFSTLKRAITGFLDMLEDLEHYKSRTHRSVQQLQLGQGLMYDDIRTMPGGRDREKTLGLRPRARLLTDPVAVSPQEAAYVSEVDAGLFPFLVLKSIIIRRGCPLYFHNYSVNRDTAVNAFLDAGFPSRSIRSWTQTIKQPFQADVYRYSTMIDLEAAPEACRARVPSVVRDTSREDAIQLAVRQAIYADTLLWNVETVLNRMAAMLALTPEYAAVTWQTPAIQLRLASKTMARAPLISSQTRTPQTRTPQPQAQVPKTASVPQVTSTGKKAAIGIGIGVGMTALGVGGYVLYRKYKGK
jgi:hypothetical protein